MDYSASKRNKDDFKKCSVYSREIMQKNIILAANKELYTYGFFLILSKVLFFGISVLFGIIQNVLWESIVFYIEFSVLWQYAGGYHASKENVCMVATSGLLFVFALAIWLAERIANVNIWFICLQISQSISAREQMVVSMEFSVPVQYIDIILWSLNFSLTQPVSMLNEQDISLGILILLYDSYQWLASVANSDYVVDLFSLRI